MRKIQRLIRKRISNNRRGGIEGLPLQLMIVIIVATMGTGIILGWMSNIETPQSIGSVDVLSNDIELRNGSTYNGYADIRVTDQDGNPIEGATVVLTGLGVTDVYGKTAHGHTDSDGKISFNGLRITMKGDIGFVTVNVSHPDFGENNTARIAVIG
jgi:hypothetical protein